MMVTHARANIAKRRTSLYLELRVQLLVSFMRTRSFHNLAEDASYRQHRRNL